MKTDVKVEVDGISKEIQAIKEKVQNVQKKEQATYDALSDDEMYAETGDNIQEGIQQLESAADYLGLAVEELKQIKTS